MAIESSDSFFSRTLNTPPQRTEDSERDLTQAHLPLPKPEDKNQFVLPLDVEGRTL